MCRSPLLPLFARELGADARLIGLIVGASTLTGVVLKLPAGAWSDVLGRRALLVTGAARLCRHAVHLSGSVRTRTPHRAAGRCTGAPRRSSVRLRPPVCPISHHRTVERRGSARIRRFRARDRRSGLCSPATSSRCGRFDLAFLLAGVIAISTPLIVWRWPAAPRSTTPDRATVGQRCGSFPMASRRSHGSVASSSQVSRRRRSSC